MVKFFYQPACIKCPPAKKAVEVLKKRGVYIEEYDVSTANGLAEATLCGILSIPTIILTVPGKDPEIFTNNFDTFLSEEFL